MKLDADEKELLESVERGEWKSAGGGKRERTRYARYGKAMPVKDSLSAATALAHDLAVATRNRSDFVKAGVRIVDPFVR